MFQRQAFARPLPVVPQAPVLIVWATQTGAAEGFAQATDEQLQAAGIDTQLIEFYDLKLDDLASAREVLLLVSTTYDGDPPDMAEEFARQWMDRPAALARLQYGLLALGDSDYDRFCGFGRRLHEWLLQSGAHALFDPVEVDDENTDALDAWFQRIGAFVRARAPTPAVSAMRL